MKKNLILSMNLSLIILISFGFSHSFADGNFKLSVNIYASEDMDFEPHVGEGDFDNYLIQVLPFSPAKNLLLQLEKSLGHKLINRGEAHITALTPPEYQKIKKWMDIEEINKIAEQTDIQNAKFQVVCLGKGELQEQNKVESTYFVVIRSQDLLNLRQNISEKLLRRKAPADAFAPQNFYPHITIGFTKRDLHEQDGVMKNSNSCISSIEMVP